MESLLYGSIKNHYGATIFGLENYRLSQKKKCPDCINVIVIIINKQQQTKIQPSSGCSCQHQFA